MATQVVMPKWGLTMHDATIVKWLKREGDPIQKDEPLLTVMTEKIVHEVTAPDTGILARILAREKAKIPVGQALAIIAAPGEEIPELEVAPAVAAPPAVEERPEVRAPKPETARPSVLASPAARRLARELGVDITRVTTTGPRISEDDVRRYHEEQSRIVASPLARRMAEEEGLDLGQIEGTGPGGRITEEDVLRALEKRAVPAAAPAGRIPFAGMRQAIAEHMVHSLQTMAQVSMSTRADVTELKATREALGARWGRKPSYTDLLVKAVVVALQEHPLLGARLEGDEIVLPTEYHIGVAVALEDGLIVPVVRHADQLSLLAIGEKVQDLAQRARENALEVDEVTGGTITITNLGMFGIEAFTPIINPPEVAILGVGRIVAELALVDGQVVVREVMTLSLTVDHRIVDGAPGAQFLQTLVGLLEHPALIFAGSEG
jgi:pyruvate dehydrogenase E2 component (dihydrolipoamide acetyltransferase)